MSRKDMKKLDIETRKKIEAESCRCLLYANINSLPVKPLDICKQANIKTYRNSDADMLCGSEIGLSLCYNGVFQIIVDDMQITTRRRFTIAHELGHIVLGHLLTGTNIGKSYKGVGENEYCCK